MIKINVVSVKSKQWNSQTKWDISVGTNVSLYVILTKYKWCPHGAVVKTITMKLKQHNIPLDVFSEQNWKIQLKSFLCLRFQTSLNKIYIFFKFASANITTIC